MSTYLPTPDHGLSKDAQKVSVERLENEVLLAELALGLVGSAFTGEDENRATTAVARQVNLQIRAAANPDVVSEGRGRQSITYNTVNGQRVLVDTLALATVRALQGPPAKSTASEADFRW